MPWLLLRSPWTWVLVAFAGLVFYAALQHIGWASCRAEFAQFRVDTERLGNEAKAKAAQEVASQAQHAKEARDDLQARNAALGASYERLRHASSGGRRVQSLSGAASSLSACPGKPDQPDTAAGFLAQVEGRVTAILEAGDREIAKYVELWKLEQANAQKR
jgi:hypothetical protein